MARPAKPMYPPSPALAPVPSPGADVMADGALSVEKAAEFAADLSRDEIEKAISRGEIRVCHRGRRVVIPKAEMVRWLGAMWDAEHPEPAR